MALLSVEEAEKEIWRHAGDFGTEMVPLAYAAGRILRDDIRAERDHPPYDRVMMDGIACRVADKFPLVCEGLHPAGAPPRFLSEGRVCLEVTTGAVLPEGADCVVPVEHLRYEDGSVFLQEGVSLQKGQFIHPQGSDASEGVVVLRAGMRLTGPALAVLAANGVVTVRVNRQPHIAVISTGDELVDVGAVVQSWQVRRSNDYAVLGMLQQHGVARVERFSVADDETKIEQCLEQVLATYDVIVMSGGVSMGALDYVPRVLEARGVEKIFHKVAQRPGGPLWFGCGPAGQHVFGLPGNPVSAMVCMARYVLPLLARMSGSIHERMPRKYLACSLSPLSERTRFVPVRCQEGERVMPCPMPTSGDFMALAHTDGIVEILPGSQDVPEGETVRFYGWSS